MRVDDQQFPASAAAAPDLSIVIPLYNEREVLPICVERLERLLASLELTIELLFVDDGSRDAGAQWLIDHPPQHAVSRIIRLSRRFGKEAAMSAGMEMARGNAVVLIDADLQDPPEMIPEMLDQWRNGVDVVLMQRRSRGGESLLKRLGSRLFYRLLQHSSTLEIPVDVGDFRLMSRRAVDALNLLPERNRYMKGLFAWVGMPTVVLQYDRAPRAAGSSKWNYLELGRLAVEGITSFSTKPLKLAILLGLVAALCGGAFGFWIMFKALAFGDPVRGYPSLIAIITFLGGAQLITVGIVGEYVGKTYIESKQRPLYLIRDVIEPEKPTSSQ
ncbi:MAG: glycosyltransferase family 2 protein [Pseudomonadota bacterium]